MNFKMNYIKSASVNGRAGHQLAEWNTALVLSERYGMKLVHTPLNHGWEYQLQFGKGEVMVNEINYDKIINLPKFDRNNIEDMGDEINKHENTLFILAEGQNLANHYVVEETLKNKWKNSPANQPFEGGFNVGVHIRRGDVNRHIYPNRWVDTSVYEEIIEKQIQDKYDNFKLHIFSEGHTDNFYELKKFKPIFHLNEDKFRTFNMMTKCDVLVTGKSGYSYFASILSEGKIIAIPFWHDYPDDERIMKYGK